MRVYVVEWSESSKRAGDPGFEHGIEAIYTNREDAELCCAKQKHYLHYFIDEYDLDGVAHSDDATG